MRRRSWRLSVLLFLGSLLFFGRCTESTTAPTSTTTISPLFNSVVPTVGSMGFQSPLLSPTASPAAVAFRINRPVREGDTLVSGTGPANVPIRIQDVTFMGELLGQGTVDDHGAFSIRVPELEQAHRIGLALGSLEGTPWKEADFQDEAFRGDQAMLVPNVGFFLDSAMVNGE